MPQDSRVVGRGRKEHVNIGTQITKHVKLGTIFFKKICAPRFTCLRESLLKHVKERTRKREHVKSGTCFQTRESWDTEKKRVSKHVNLATHNKTRESRYVREKRRRESEYTISQHVKVGTPIVNT